MKQDTETWAGLNRLVRVADEATCFELLKVELRGKRRKQFILRLHSRINKIRAHRERDELLYVLTSGQASLKGLKWLR